MLGFAISRALAARRHPDLLAERARFLSHIENRFFSGMVRIQTERGHHVVTSGPYRWIRHPGYAGALLTCLATPLFLDPHWAFLPAAFLAGVLAIRTALEDRTLQAELKGYRDYAQRVRYRLLSGIW